VSVKQVAVLDTALAGALQDNIATIAKEAGVRRATIYEWLNQDHRCYSAKFKEAWNGLFDLIIKDALPLAGAALRRKAATGDVAAIKLLLELLKKYQPSWLKVEASGSTLEALVLASMNGNGSPKPSTPKATKARGNGNGKPSRGGKKKRKKVKRF
jgi:hypothetical protein